MKAKLQTEPLAGLRLHRRRLNSLFAWVNTSRNRGLQQGASPLGPGLVSVERDEGPRAAGSPKLADSDVKERKTNIAQSAFLSGCWEFFSCDVKNSAAVEQMDRCDQYPCIIRATVEEPFMGYR